MRHWIKCGACCEVPHFFWQHWIWWKRLFRPYMIWGFDTKTWTLRVRYIEFSYRQARRCIKENRTAHPKFIWVMVKGEEA